MFHNYLYCCADTTLWLVSANYGGGGVWWWRDFCGCILHSEKANLSFSCLAVLADGRVGWWEMYRRSKAVVAFSWS